MHKISDKEPDSIKQQIQNKVQFQNKDTVASNIQAVKLLNGMYITQYLIRQ